MCGNKKEFSEFSKKKGGSFYHSYCRKCSTKRAAAHYEENRHKILKRIHLFYEKNKDVLRERSRKESERLRLDTLSKYGSKCVCCGEKEPKFLALDHKDNDGNQHRRLLGRVNMYRWAKHNNYPDKFQLLCHNCNMAKAFYKICPHQIKI